MNYSKFVIFTSLPIIIFRLYPNSPDTKGETKGSFWRYNDYVKPPEQGYHLAGLQSQLDFSWSNFSYLGGKLQIKIWWTVAHFWWFLKKSPGFFRVLCLSVIDQPDEIWVSQTGGSPSHHRFRYENWFNDLDDSGYAHFRKPPNTRLVNVNQEPMVFWQVLGILRGSPYLWDTPTLSLNDG